ncbi:MAG: hypothetical protein CBC84_002715 [Pelagibacteraceae bacterium TMED124]|nr:hypothetical protein [Rickettsiales bacterium]RPG16654.1 MAG: hypothetical protein CBC84_002715 [Pelagibacteraceae bacterium TMED124]|tara:strand:+ start:883 stop:2010 length:1128 start_codon:yes stop_codon:yes gene_type:complete
MKISTISSIEDSKTFCEKFFEDSSPFISFEFFKCLERTGCTNFDTGWEPEHLIIENNRKSIGFIPNFRKQNSNGEYIFDHVFANAHHQIGTNYYPKYLSAIPFTPVTKNKIIYSEKEIDTKQLSEVLKKYCTEKKISSFHFNFIDKKKSELLDTHGFYQRTGIQYYWYNRNYENFSCFLKNLKTKKRKNIVKERENLKKNDINLVIKRGDEICIEDINLFFECYLNTIDKKWSIAYLKHSFFDQLLRSTVKQKIVLIQAFQKNKFVGCSLHFIGEKTLYGRYWGCLKEIPFLHFELCYYSAIEFAIKNNLKKVEAGAQGEHKIARGYEPTLTYSNHWFGNTKLNPLIKSFLVEEKKKVKDTINYLNKFLPFKLRV